MMNFRPRLKTDTPGTNGIGGSGGGPPAVTGPQNGNPNLGGNVQGAGQAGSGVAGGLAQGPEYGQGTVYTGRYNKTEGQGTGNTTDPNSPGFVIGGDTTGNTGQAEWGGTFGGANATANSLGGMAATARGRQGQNLSAIGGNGYWDPGAAQAQRGMAKDAMSGLAQQAQGNGPSAAQVQMGASLGGSSLSDAYAAMRGVAGSSAIQGLGATNAGAVAQGGAGRAAEVANAQGSYLQGAGNLRNQDIAQMGLMQNYGIDQANADLATQKENEQASLAYDTMAQQTLGDQLAANASEYNTGIGNQGQLGAIQIGNQAQQNQQTMSAIMGAGSGVAQAAANAYQSQQSTAPGLAQDPYAEEGTSFEV
jgi:hypothetical protein